ncbi:MULTISPECIES: hypothetical protein [Halomonadaceae]|uniref:Uncharacterized protein n=1 Tax=Vreelandella sp. SM1641 TaxID=3126101 RepID=A0AAU7XRQ6_9GAMM|nr:hypothetical protein [Halomonas sp. KO116]AJY51406.1 hypothetical protein KO116_02933 [Halomonas sp. KO116]
MHFRVRRHVVQLIRMTYDPSIKRGRAEVVGSVKLINPVLSDDLRAHLSSNELSEFDVWLTTHHRANWLKQELAALTLAEQMAQAQLWFEQQEEGQESAQLVADSLLRSWHPLRKVLKQRGLLE